jgi:glucose/arabinose dehydrogenase
VETGRRAFPSSARLPGQTRAPAVKTRTPLQVTEIASGFDRPWAIAFLPDGRMLVTEKPGHLRIVTAAGRSPSRCRACRPWTLAARAACSTWSSARTSAAAA